jgi:hypothetical protein
LKDAFLRDGESGLPAGLSPGRSAGSSCALPLPAGLCAPEPARLSSARGGSRTEAADFFFRRFRIIVALEVDEAVAAAAAPASDAHRCSNAGIKFKFV